MPWTQGEFDPAGVLLLDTLALPPFLESFLVGVAVPLAGPETAGSLTAFLETLGLTALSGLYSSSVSSGVKVASDSSSEPVSSTYLIQVCSLTPFSSRVLFVQNGKKSDSQVVVKVRP